MKSVSKVGIGLVLIAIIAIVVISKSIETISPGERGAMFYKWGSGVDTTNVLGEGVQIIAPWNDLIVYDVKQKKEDMQLSVLDKKGLTVKIDFTVLYHPKPNKIGVIHKNIGRDYNDIIIRPESRSVVRQVIGKYTAEELYSTKRGELQADCESIIEKTLTKYNLILDGIKIRDVDLPIKITTAIEAKQEQEQINLKAQLKEEEENFLADAKIAQAKGNKQAKVLEAEGEAEAIRLKQKELAKSPQYTNYIKWKNYSEKGKSPYGENNIYGSNAASIIKGLK